MLRNWDRSDIPNQFFAARAAHSNFHGKLTQLNHRGSIAMKTHRIGLWALPFIFAFFPAAAQAQMGTFRLYAGVAPTTYKISFDQNPPTFVRSPNSTNQTPT